MASVPLPGAPAVFCSVSCRWLPLAGSAIFLAPVSWPTPAVETCCWVGGVFGAPLGFLPCAVLFLRGLRFVQLPLPQLTLGGFSAFSVTGCLTYCYSLVAWVGRQPFPYISVLLLRQLACRGLLGSAPCVGELPLALCLLFGRQCNDPACFPLP